MRDIERIDQFLEILRKCWTEVPDWRFGQLIENVKRYANKDDLFYMEEPEFMQLLIDYFDLDEKSGD